MSDIPERAVIARVFGVLLCGGAVLGFASLPVLPAGTDLLGSEITGAVALAAGLALLVGRQRVPMLALYAACLLGTALITSALFFNGQFSDDTEFLYMWVGLVSFYFFTWRAATVQAAGVAFAFALYLAMEDHSNGAPVRWVVVVVTVATTGVLVSLLRDRVERLITRLTSAARTDPLTQLLNRRAFDVLLAWEVERAARGGRPVSVLLADLDHFKAVNDRFGHVEGDVALQRAAAALRDVTRRTDTLARIGGEEFAVIAPDSDERSAFVLAERMRCAVRDTFAGEPVALTASFGLAAMPNHASDPDGLVGAADDALYAAKELGRDRTVIHSAELRAVAPVSKVAHAERDAEVDARLIEGREALAAQPAWLHVPEDGERDEIVALLDEGAIVPVFQPIVALTTGHVVGYEALARFPALPDRGPDVVFAQAYRCGLGPELEAASLRAALRCDGRPEGAFLAVNVRPSALTAATVRAALPDDLRGIVVEVTEQELAPDEQGMAGELDDLRARGALIAVDDAGSAYASLHRVMRMRPDIIKLDRPLVADISVRADKAALVEALVGFAHRTGAAVCAEGIEELDDLGALADLDVHYGQGYAIARPSAPWVAVPELVRETLLRRSQSSPVGRDGYDVNSGADRRLEHLAAKLTQVRSLADLDGVTDILAAELRADEVVCSRWHADRDAVETLSERRWSPTGELYPLGRFPLTRRVLSEQVAVQVLAGDPAADRAEIGLLRSEGGHRALLMIPVVARGETFGLIEAFSFQERPWSATAINRARIVSAQLGAVLAGLDYSEPLAAGSSERNSSSSELKRAGRSSIGT
ncbi:MAG TPA: diguanylate cyclase [Solirubrobacteraceae bacterium]|nr:diguanylate cyclase [Solirubrobacteraceae bacterium]